MSTLSPRSLEGKYEVLARLREGGMGAIYKVRHRLLNELRVIKVMRPDIAQSADQRKRFVREAQTATRLRHPNIVAFYDFFVDEEDTAFMVMEYIEGINLRDTIREHGPFPVSLGLDLSRQCLSAFDYLHRKGIVHRDVSPDNIMMTRDEDGTVRTKLIDLGIAKIAQATEELTAANEFIGKLRYSSPEQLMKSTSSGKIDSRSDLFSFGIVVYELLTGVCPYGGEDIHEIVTNRLNQPPLPFTESDAKGRLSPALRDCVMKALQKFPENRYQTAAEFGKALEALTATATTEESAEQDARYANSALAKALGSVATLEKTQDLPAPVKAQSEIGAASLPTDGRDLKFRSTIAKWSATTPPTPDYNAPTLLLGDARKETLSLPPPAPSATASTRPVAGEPERSRKTAMAGYAAVAASAALLVGFGVWIAGRERGSEPGRLDFPTTPSLLRDRLEQQRSAASAPMVSTRSTALPDDREESNARRPEIAAPQERPATPVELAVRSEPTPGPSMDKVATAPPASSAARVKSTPKPAAAKPKPTAPSRIAQLLPTKVPSPSEGSSPPTTDIRTAEDRGDAAAVKSTSSAPPAATSQYCLMTERTTYGQGVVREAAPGFGGSVGNRAPRPDSALMELKVSLDTARPVDDQQFFVILRFENGGPSRVEIKSLEQMSSRGEMRQVLAPAVPVAVAAGGIKELYRYAVKLSGGEAYNKSFAVTDARGDSWSTTFRVVPCGD